MWEYLKKVFHIHEWEYLGTWHEVYQHKRCKICGKLKIVAKV